MTKINKIMVSLFMMLMFAGFNYLNAQSSVNVSNSGANSKPGTYTLTISPMNAAVAAKLNELSTSGRLIHLESIDQQTGVCVVSPANSQITLESIQNYLKGYLGYNDRVTPKNQLQTR